MVNKKFETFWLVIHKKTGEALHAPEEKKHRAKARRWEGVTMHMRQNMMVIPVRECPGAVYRKRNVDGRRRYWWVAIRSLTNAPSLIYCPTNSKAAMIKWLGETQRFPKSFRVVKMVQV